MTRKFLSTYALTAASLLVFDWFLLWARFYWFGFGDVTKQIFTIVNFPWSIAYFWIEAKRNPWWYAIFDGRFENVLNDEIGPLLLFLLIVLLQALVFAGIISRMRTHRGPKIKESLRSI